MWMNNVLKLVWKAVQVPSDGVGSARAFLVKVDAQMAAGVIEGAVNHEVKFYGIHPDTGFAG